MKYQHLASIAFVTFFALPALADEGRRHISGPKTITEAGTYVVTRSFTSASDPIILIAADDVTLDLNGQLITSTNAAATIIKIQDGKTRITIKNGRLSGGGKGIWNTNTSIAPPGILRVFIENVEVNNTATNAILLRNLQYVEVISCRLITGSSAILLTGPTNGTYGGKITGNEVIGFTSDGYYLLGLLSGEVSYNQMRDCNMSSGIQISGAPGQAAGGNIVENNTVSMGPGAVLTSGIVTSDSGNNIIRNNVLRNCSRAGIWLGYGSDHNIISGNIASANTGIGIAVGDILGRAVPGSNYNLIEGNEASGNAGCGAGFYGVSVGNAYRGNMLRNNIGGAVCGAAGRATDEGGNIP